MKARSPACVALAHQSNSAHVGKSKEVDPKGSASFRICAPQRQISNASREESLSASSPQRLRVAAEPGIARLRCFLSATRGWFHPVSCTSWHANSVSKGICCHDVQNLPHFMYVVSGNGQPDIHLPRHTLLQDAVEASPSEGTSILPHLPSQPTSQALVVHVSLEGEFHVGPPKATLKLEKIGKVYRKETCKK